MNFKKKKEEEEEKEKVKLPRPRAVDPAAGLQPQGMFTMVHSGISHFLA